MVEALRASRPEARSAVEDHALALVRGDVAEAQRAALQVAFLRDHHVVGGDGARDDALAQPEADVRHHLPGLALGDVDGLQHAGDAGPDDALEDDAAARALRTQPHERAVVDRALGPQTAPGPLQLLEHALFATDEEEGFELSGPRRELGVLLAGRGADRDPRSQGVVGLAAGDRLLGEATVSRPHVPGELVGELHPVPEAADEGRLAVIVEVAARQYRRDRGAERRRPGRDGLGAHPEPGEGRVEHFLERAVGDDEPRRDEAAAEPRHLGEVRRLPADERVELEACFLGGHDPPVT